MNTPMRVMHLITGLNTGGAEMALSRLVTHLDPLAFESRVVSMIPPGPVGKQMQAQGIPVESLEMPPGRATPEGILKLIARLRRFRPDVLQTWLYHADLLGLLAGKVTGIPAIAWNIRSSEMDFSQYRRLSGLVVKTCARLSGLPSVVVVNARIGQANHEAYGYRPRRWEYIPNGVDTALFAPNPAAGREVRAGWGVSARETLVGLVGRLDPQKDHPTFLEAAALAHKRHPGLRFVCVGSGPKAYEARLKERAAQLGISQQVLWAGIRADMPAVYNALDLLVLSSAYGEGFPNVVAEAMACGLPCAVTDTGDTAMLAKETGAVVPPKSAPALAQAMLDELARTAQERARRSQQGREFIEQNFSLSAMVAKYAGLYRQLAGRGKA